MTLLKTMIFGSRMRSSHLRKALVVGAFMLLPLNAFCKEESDSPLIFALNETSDSLVLTQSSSNDEAVKDDSLFASQSLFGFANYLFDNKDYYRAITEYERFIYLYPQSPLVLSAKYKIGLCYFKGEKYKEAAEYFGALSTLPEKNEATKDALFKLAETYYKDTRYADAVEVYRRFYEEYPDANEAQNAKYNIGWAYIFSKQYDDAKKSFDNVPSNSPFYSVSSNVSSELSKYDELPHRSPTLAGGLSAVIPGAGQLYCGRGQDAALAFILNGVLIWSTIELFNDDNPAAGGIFAFFSLTWYSGNVYGAVSSANKFNRDTEANFIKNLDTKYNLNLSLKHDPESDSNLIVLNLQW